MDFEQALLASYKSAGYEAGRMHLREGRPIYYMDPAYPDEIVKEYPDGIKEIVALDDQDNEILIRSL